MKNKLGIWKVILKLIVLYFSVYIFLECVLYIVNKVTYEPNSEISPSFYKYIDSKMNCSDDKFDKKKLIEEAMSDNKIVGYEYLKIKNAHLVCLYRQKEYWWTIGYWKYYMNTENY